MTISPTLLLSNQTQQQSTASSSKNVLGKDDFLKLLVTQLQQQDPMNPMQNSDFISQMATFTSLEQTQNMSDTLTKFVDSQSGANLGNQASMIGKTITWSQSDSSTDSSSASTTPATQSGVVTAVSLKNGQLTYMVGDTSVDPSTITKIQTDVPTSSAAPGGSGV
ncbi:MAG TPA: flagellar hook capping FlgD N-terminal domain-containing protein [Sporolactobacillaceae bacterium]|nr:flagellar hook capping FlgD N-terminal domain-containing protein [Sporolactobacillaceae bacterium]